MVSLATALSFNLNSIQTALKITLVSLVHSERASSLVDRSRKMEGQLHSYPDIFCPTIRQGHSFVSHEKIFFGATMKDTFCVHMAELGGRN